MQQDHAIAVVPRKVRIRLRLQSTSLAIWNGVRYGRAMCTRPTAGAGYSNRSCRATGARGRGYIFEATRPSPTRIFTSSLEVEGMGYTIRLPANRVLQDKIGYLLKRPVGRPSHEVRRYYASFGYQAQSWKKPRRVVAKVEWHPGELYPRGGFIVTNLARPAERIVAFYNRRGTCEQYIKEG